MILIFNFKYLFAHLSSAQFWKFAVTGADENRELKVWSCETWSCLQTLTLSPSPNVPLNFQVMPCIKAGLDASATYMVLSDIKRKVPLKLKLTVSFMCIHWCKFDLI